MPDTLTQEKADAADARIDAFMVDVDAVQKNYFLNKGRYWQGIRTHDVVPSEEQKANPKRTRQATDCETWTEAGISLSNNLPISIEVDVYQNGDEQGYVCIFRTMHNGVLFERAINHGIESHREQSWHSVILSTV